MPPWVPSTWPAAAFVHSHDSASRGGCTCRTIVLFSCLQQPVKRLTTQRFQALCARAPPRACQAARAAAPERRPRPARRSWAAGCGCPTASRTRRSASRPGTPRWRTARSSSTTCRSACRTCALRLPNPNSNPTLYMAYSRELIGPHVARLADMCAAPPLHRQPLAHRGICMSTPRCSTVASAPVLRISALPLYALTCGCLQVWTDCGVEELRQRARARSGAARGAAAGAREQGGQAGLEVADRKGGKAAEGGIARDCVQVRPFFWAPRRPWAGAHVLHFMLASSISVWC